MNYFNQLSDDFTLDCISNKMLLKSNIIDFNHNKQEDNIPDATVNKTKFNKTMFDKNIIQRRDTDKFYPRDKDTLFWCYYIYKNGIDQYFDNKKRSFILEKEFKISTIDKIQTIKDRLKTNKIKKVTVEDELINKNLIGIPTLRLFMFLDTENAIIIRKNCYQKIIFNNDKTDIDIDNFFVLFCDRDQYAINRNLKTSDLKTLVSDRYEVTDFEKPLKGVSSYRVDELHEIAKEVNISILNPETGKNKTKQTLYSMILERLLQ